MPAASDGAQPIVSIGNQHRAPLPYVAVRGSACTVRSSRSPSLVYFLSAGVSLITEPDKQAQESVTGCYITRNAAEPHDFSVSVVEGPFRPSGRIPDLFGFCFCFFGYRHIAERLSRVLSGAL